MPSGVTTAARRTRVCDVPMTSNDRGNLFQGCCQLVERKATRRAHPRLRGAHDRPRQADFLHEHSSYGGPLGAVRTRVCDAPMTSSDRMTSFFGS